MADTIVDMLRGHDRTLALKAAALQGQFFSLYSLPVQPGLLEALECELVASSIHASAAIAGNPMRLDEVRAELDRAPDDPEPPSGPTVARARREVSNLVLAYGPLPIGRTEGSVFGVAEGFVRKVHTVMAQGTVKAGLGEYAPLPGGSRSQAQTQNEVLKLVTWANAPEFTADTVLVRAALFHYGFMRLQPFAEANGRVARFFETSVLTVGGVRFVSLMMPAFYQNNIDEYLSFFLEESKQTSSDFLEFFLSGVEQGLESMRGQLVKPLRGLALAAYFEDLRETKQVKTRLFEFLNLLLAHEGSFQLKDLFLRQPFKLLYNRVSEHTARRDLKKLMALGLLHKEEVYYTFNRDVLG